MQKGLSLALAIHMNINTLNTQSRNTYMYTLFKGSKFLMTFDMH